MSASEELRVPNTGAIEDGLAVTKAAVQLVPIVGGSIAELIGLAGQKYVNAQYDRYFDGVAHRCESRYKELTATIAGFPESLATNRVFQASLMQLAREAIFAEDAEKMGALCEAAVNSALPTAPEDLLRQQLLRMVGELTTGHIRLLKFFWVLTLMASDDAMDSGRVWLVLR